MTKKTLKDEKLLINTIFSNLPMGVPGMELRVTDTINLAKKYLSDKSRIYETDDNIYLHSLRVAVKVSEYAKKISQNGFFRYDLIMIALLHDIIEDADCPDLRAHLEIYRDYGSNSILKGINALTNDNNKIQEIGRSKYMGMKFIELSKNTDLFLIKLLDRLDNLSGLSSLDKSNEEQRLFSANYLLESLMCLQSLYLDNYVVPNVIYDVYDEFVSLLNKQVF